MSMISLLVLPVEEFISWFRWWYGAGLRWMGRWFLDEVRTIEEREHLLTWAHHLLTPMYGEWSIQGRLISVGVRLVVLVYRLIWSMAWLVLHSIFFVSYVLMPVLAIAMLLTRFRGV